MLFAATQSAAKNFVDLNFTMKMLVVVRFDRQSMVSSTKKLGKQIEYGSFEAAFGCMLSLKNS